MALFTFIGLLARQNVSSQFLIQAIPPAPSSPELEPSSLAPEEAPSPDSVIISSAPSQSGEGTADPATIASTEASRQVKENLKRSNFECEETNNSVSMRRTLIRESLQILPSAGLFGIGLSSFAGISCLTRDPHNSILQAAVEFGPLGGLFLALIILSVVRGLWMVRDRKSSEANFVLCSFAFVAIMDMAHGHLMNEILFFAFAGYASQLIGLAREGTTT